MMFFFFQAEDGIRDLTVTGVQTCALPITKGKVAIEGVDLATMSDDQKSGFRARRMGFIFQAYNLLPVLNAQENVELPLLLAGVSEADAHKEALSALKTVGLEEWRL